MASRRLGVVLEVLPVLARLHGRVGDVAVPAAHPAIVTLALIGSFLVDTDELDGRASNLRFEGPHVEAGSAAPVVYTPSSLLSSEDSIVVRARYRSADDRRDTKISSAAAGILHRRSDGKFEGLVRIPEAAAYGTFAVEAPDGSKVDSNHRELWELLIAGPWSERVSLQQKVHDLLRRNWTLAARTQRAIAEADPGDAVAWKEVFFLDLELVQHADQDSLRAWHRKQFERLDTRYRDDRDLTGRIAGEMLWYARGLNDSTTAARWRDVLLRRFPRSPRAVAERVAGVADSASRLERFERLWAEVGPAHIFLPQTAALLALEEGAAATAARWLNRYVEMRPEAALWAYRHMARFSETRDAAVSALRSEVRRLEALHDEDRPLESTRSGFRREAGPRIAEARFQLAHALLSTADTSSAEASLREAVEWGWHAEALHDLAVLQISRGDPDATLRLLARAAADPLATLDGDSARALLGAAFDQDRWHGHLANARRSLMRHVIEGATNVALPSGLALEDATGRRHELEDLLDDRPTVIAFWSPFCSPSIEVLPELQSLSDRLESRGGQLLLVSTEPLDARAITILRTAGVRSRPYVDASIRLRTALAQWATPELFVIDGAGKLRFAASPLQRVDRQVAAISVVSP